MQRIFCRAKTNQVDNSRLHQTSNVWRQNMSCLHPIRTCFFLTYTLLDATDGITGDDGLVTTNDAPLRLFRTKTESAYFGNRILSYTNRSSVHTKPVNPVNETALFWNHPPQQFKAPTTRIWLKICGFKNVRIRVERALYTELVILTYKFPFEFHWPLLRTTPLRQKQYKITLKLEAVQILGSLWNKWPLNATKTSPIPAQFNPLRSPLTVITADKNASSLKLSHLTNQHKKKHWTKGGKKTVFRGEMLIQTIGSEELWLFPQNHAVNLLLHLTAELVSSHSLHQSVVPP